jgi:hypothetical protein
VQFTVNDGNGKNEERGFYIDDWGRGLKRRPLPQTPTLARRCKDVEIKAETVPKAFVTI